MALLTKHKATCVHECVKEDRGGQEGEAESGRKTGLPPLQHVPPINVCRHRAHSTERTTGPGGPGISLPPHRGLGWSGVQWGGCVLFHRARGSQVLLILCRVRTSRRLVLLVCAGVFACVCVVGVVVAWNNSKIAGSVLLLQNKLQYTDTDLLVNSIDL